MPSFSDSVFIFFIALLIFGPKKLPELARQLGKLMAEFRRASNEFRMQMEDELRLAEQADQQKKIAAMEAAAPPQAALASESENTIAPPREDEIERHPHDQIYDEPALAESASAESASAESASADATSAEPGPLPIASSGELKMMPPETGLPVESSSVSAAFNSIPQAPDPAANPAAFSDSPSVIERASDATEPATEALHG